MLQTEPSFCIYTDEEGSFENEKGQLETKSSKQSENGEFTFGETSMGLIVEDEEYDRSIGLKNSGSEDIYNEDHEQMQPLSPKMYLATGFGIDGIGGTEFKSTIFSESAAVDGESLMHYAKFIWEVHRDQDRASSYFEKAAIVANGDCNILAAYAGFLWEIDEDC